jgi:hypothetical protein
MKKFTDEELSRILTAHANGFLEKSGFSWFENIALRGCINQFAYNECWVDDAARLNKKVSSWFDVNYNPSMSAEDLFSALEKLGAA